MPCSRARLTPSSGLTPTAAATTPRAMCWTRFRPAARPWPATTSPAPAAGTQRPWGSCTPPRPPSWPPGRHPPPAQGPDHHHPDPLRDRPGRPRRHQPAPAPGWSPPGDPVEHRAPGRALGRTAQRVLAARQDPHQLEAELRQLLTVLARPDSPNPGIGPITAVMVRQVHHGPTRASTSRRVAQGRANARSAAAASTPWPASSTDSRSTPPPTQPAVDPK